MWFLVGALLGGGMTGGILLRVLGTVPACLGHTCPVCGYEIEPEGNE